MSRALLIVRIASLLVVSAATAYALDWWVLVPLRCSHAASVGAAEIDEAGDAADYATQRVVRRVGAKLQGCDCVTPPDARIFFVPPTTAARWRSTAGRRSISTSDSCNSTPRTAPLRSRIWCAPAPLIHRASARSTTTSGRRSNNVFAPGMVRSGCGKGRSEGRRQKAEVETGGARRSLLLPSALRLQ